MLYITLESGILLIHISCISDNILCIIRILIFGIHIENYFFNISFIFLFFFFCKKLKYLESTMLLVFKMYSFVLPASNFIFASYI